MCNGFWLINVQFSLDEDEVVDDEIPNPLELIGLETALVLIPSEEVLPDRLAKLFDVV